MEVLQFIFFVSFFSIIPFHFGFNHLFRHNILDTQTFLRSFVHA
ncbi:hypothetical protein BTBSAS_50012 [Brochothrix thermosphacta]|uniref:Uncharacterized protein n=1 Tax=Brochothrix thermosphacta TaxID=2756 RepID=A0A2X0QLM3_BROTH|nr:hypothetical protein BTBSAS_50012 [Brochothrix thermosphacta]